MTPLATERPGAFARAIGRSGRVLLLAAMFGGPTNTGARAEDAPDPSDSPIESTRVTRGETLWQLAELHYGDGSLWAAIYLENRDRIKDPAVIYAGQRLSIPPVAEKSHADLRREGRELLRR